MITARNRVQYLIISILTILIFNNCAYADTPGAIREDLVTILKGAKLPDQLIQLELATKPDATANTIEIKCNAADRMLFVINSKPEELVSTFYYSLHKIGFQFPHPRVQLSPELTSLKSHCGKTYTWQPALAYRGFHYHTQHPNEWVAGFFTNQDPLIAKDTVLWLARNFQNVMQLQLLKNAVEVYSAKFLDPLKLARDLQIRVGVAVSLASLQQKSYNLLPFWRVTTGYKAYPTLMSQIDKLLKLFAIDFLTIELGTTEFTSTNYENTIEWLGHLGAHLRSLNKFLLVRAHVSTNQYNSEYGNYNFIVEHTNPTVGLLAHTVMYYGLLDNHAPVYGRKNFSDMHELLKRSAKQRVSWYHPETSYFVGLDIDAPLFLTDYLRARANDFKVVTEMGVKGHLNFTSGQELGYWLFDWNTALQANKEYLGQENIALKILGEDLAIWQKIIDFQSQYIKGADLLGVLSFESPLDQIPYIEQPHSRTTINNLFKNESVLRDEISRLEKAEAALPDLTLVKNEELKLLLEVTFLRISHALQNRLAILNQFMPAKKSQHLANAQTLRAKAFEKMATISTKFNRYPKAQIFEKLDNPTSYKYGYGYPAKSLYFWEREEALVTSPTFNPLFMNIYDPIEFFF